jgi:hypothetical protein
MQNRDACVDNIHNAAISSSNRETLQRFFNITYKFLRPTLHSATNCSDYTLFQPCVCVCVCECVEGILKLSYNSN